MLEKMYQKTHKADYVPIQINDMQGMLYHVLKGSSNRTNFKRRKNSDRPCYQVIRFLKSIII